MKDGDCQMGMEMKKVLVTGANGYIGRHVVDALIELGCQVVAVDFVLDGVNDKAEKKNVSIFDNENVFEECGRPDACVHLAWRDGFVHNSMAHIEDLPKHYKFVKSMIESGLKQIAIMGTMHEVGYWEGAIDENTPTNPSSNYGIAKDALRNLTCLLAKENNCCWQWLRAYYIYGDDMRGNSIFSKIAAAEREGKDKFPFTTGKNKYDFIEVEMLASQIAASVVQDEVDGIINCCSGKPVSLSEEVEGFIKKRGFNIKLEYGAFPDRPYDSPAVWGDATKINSIMKKRV